MRLHKLFILVSLVLVTVPAFAQSDDQVLAERGKGVVTQDEFSARIDKIPPQHRRAVLRDGKRLSDVVTAMLLRAQLAADAREAGFDKEAIVKERMRLAAETELGEAWMQYYVDMQPEADYVALARESYQVNEGKYLTDEKIDVSHILISNKERSLAETRELADSISLKLKSDPASFDTLVLEYSEDPSAASNQGKFYAVQKGQMVSQFEVAAFSLSEGEISPPVETQYGFHIIRLDARIAPSKASFDEVKDQLITQERSRHDERIQQDYIRGLASQDSVVTKEALEELVRRLFEETPSD